MSSFAHRLLVLFASLAILTVSTSAFKPVVRAQTTTFTISPALQEFKVDPGDQKVVTIEVSNLSDTAQAIHAYPRNFTAKGIEGQITFADDNAMSYAAAKWMHLSQTDFVLPPKAKEKVQVQIIVPPQAEPGGKYASVIFEQVMANTPQTGQDSEVRVATRMSALIFLTVSGDVIEAGQILGATTNSQCSAVVCGFQAPSFVDHGPIPFQFIFSNTGNVHVRPRGYITITQYGRQVARLTVEDHAVLPNSQRHFTTQWDRSLLIGPYQAKLHLQFGSNGYTLEESTTLWAIPWQAALIVGLIILIPTALLLSRKYFKLQRLQAQK